jgi:hypothetical protein
VWTAYRLTSLLAGKAHVYLKINGAKQDEFVIGPGRVKKQFQGEWHSNKCQIFYEPHEVTGGTLTINHSFDKGQKL